MANPIFKTQKAYIRYLRWKRRVAQIISIVSVLLLFLYIVMMNAHSFTAWLAFAAYGLLMMILNHHAKQAFLKQDPETAEKEEQVRFAYENRKRLRK